eukprot:8470227-Alexandrium_andersonii.AAC.1
MSSIIPASCRNSKFFSIHQNRFLLPKDLLVAHGWPVCEPLLEYADLMPKSRLHVNMRRSQSLLGNGQHLAQAGAVFLFILCHCVRRQDVAVIRPPLTWGIPESEISRSQQDTSTPEGFQNSLDDADMLGPPDSSPERLVDQQRVDV